MSDTAPVFDTTEDVDSHNSSAPPSATGTPAPSISLDEAALDTRNDVDIPFDDPILHIPFGEDEIEDDGLHQVNDHTYADTSCLSDDGDFGDKEEERIGSDAFLWKIDRHKGHHYLRSKFLVYSAFTTSDQR